MDTIATYATPLLLLLILLALPKGPKVLGWAAGVVLALGVLAVAIMLFVEFPSALVFVIGVPIVVGLIVMVIRQGQEIWKLLKKPLNTLPPD